MLANPVHRSKKKTMAPARMDSGRTDINPSWGSGWGVRLLDRLVADHYEKPEK